MIPIISAGSEQQCAVTTSVSYLDRETYVNPRSFDVALFAAGAAVAASERAMNGQHCFSLTRPPGHHAERDRANGVLPAQQCRNCCHACTGEC